MKVDLQSTVFNDKIISDTNEIRKSNVISVVSPLEPSTKNPVSTQFFPYITINEEPMPTDIPLESKCTKRHSRHMCVYVRISFILVCQLTFAIERNVFVFRSFRDSSFFFFFSRFSYIPMKRLAGR